MRAFIIGNGPSLKEHVVRGHFDLLKNEITIAMNYIDFLYEPDHENGLPGTSWRPTYYLFLENMWDGREENHWSHHVIPHHILAGENCYIEAGFRNPLEIRIPGGKYALNRMTNITWLRLGKCHRRNYFMEGRPEAWHLPTWCKYGGTMNIAAQFAFKCGFDPVYLIGNDLDHQEPEEEKGDPNHFHPGYKTYDEYPIQSRDATLNHMHSIIRSEFESKGRRIYNAGIGGELEVYDRVNLEDVIRS